MCRVAMWCSTACLDLAEACPWLRAGWSLATWDTDSYTSHFATTADCKCYFSEFVYTVQDLWGGVDC